MSRVHLEPKDEETAAEIDAEREQSDREELEELEELVARGVLRKGPTAGQPLPDWFFTRELPVAKESVLEQLLKDRHSDD
jgi:hypothetical protein